MLQPGGKVPGHGAVTPKKVPVTSVSIVEDAESNRIISKFSNTNLNLTILNFNRLPRTMTQGSVLQPGPKEGRNRGRTSCNRHDFNYNLINF